MWYSPAGGSGVIHGVLIGLRRRLGSPRAARHWRSRGVALPPHCDRIITSPRPHDTRTAIISNSLTLVASLPENHHTTIRLVDLFVYLQGARSRADRGRALHTPQDAIRTDSEHWDHALISPHTIISH